MPFQIKIGDILDIVCTAPRGSPTLANMKGLLGNNDGNEDNDFVSRNGTKYDSSSSEEQLWSFGNSCKIHPFLPLYIYYISKVEHTTADNLTDKSGRLDQTRQYFYTQSYFTV